MTRLVWLAFMAVGIASAASCSSEVTSSESGGGGSGNSAVGGNSPGGGGPDDGCGGAIACPSGFGQVSYCDQEMQPECETVSGCGKILYCEFDGSCGDTFQLCEPGDQEVDTCPQNTDCYLLNCGSKICAPAPCTVVSPCDPGDVEVDSCPFDVDCYEGYSCEPGLTPPLCGDIALPAAGCPYDMPTAGDSCADVGMECSYNTTPGCFEAYGCVATPGGSVSWELLGGGCDGSTP